MTDKPTGNVIVKRSRGRLRFSLVALLIVLLVFSGRLIQIQVVDAKTKSAEALDERLVTETLPAERGKILDAGGNVLAEDVERFNITVDQTAVSDSAQQSDGSFTEGTVDQSVKKLADVLGMSKEDVSKAIHGDKVFAYVKKGVTPETKAAVEDLKIPWIYNERTSKRIYPYENLAGNVLGFVGGDGVARAGVELAQEEKLHGTDGERKFERGADGRKIPTGITNEVAAKNGETIQLTIDRDVQWTAQKAIDKKVADTNAEWGTVVVLDVHTGEIVALADSQSMNPNDPAASDEKHRGNRAVSEVFEPGSTSKVITAAAAIEEGIATPSSPYPVNDTYTASNGQVFKDAHTHGQENMTFAGVFANSYNTGTVMAGEKLTRQQRYDYMKAFGLGTSTGINFPGESVGLMASPDQWDGRQEYTVLFGQGVSVTALQQASVLATIANKGERVAPTLIKSIVNEKGEPVETDRPDPVRVVSEKTADDVLDMMEGAAKEGTFGLLDVPGYNVAGKSGTAEAVKEDGSGYSGITASFIGVAPADDPRYLVAVTVQRPSGKEVWGAEVATPVFNDVMNKVLQTYSVPPSSHEPANLPLKY